jgi:hypothetical protein
MCSRCEKLKTFVENEKRPVYADPNWPTSQEQIELRDWQMKFRCPHCNGAGGRRSGEDCQGNTEWLPCPYCQGGGVLRK